MPHTIETRPAEYVLLPRPTAGRVARLSCVILHLTDHLSEQVRDMPVDDPAAIEEAGYTAAAIVEVAELIQDLRSARPVPAADPPAAAKAVRRPKAVAPRKAPRFDYAALPPRVEAGC